MLFFSVSVETNKFRSTARMLATVFFYIRIKPRGTLIINAKAGLLSIMTS